MVKRGKYKQAKVTNPRLATWAALNKSLLQMKEGVSMALLEEEKRGRARKGFLIRIHSRINRLRALRERNELKPDREN